MAKYVYPAVFENCENGYYVNFPDVPSCYTQGETQADAIEMAQDVLSLVMCNIEDEKQDIPKPSNIKDISCSNDSFVSLISCDTKEYRKKCGSKMVKKTLSIPGWLNEMADKADINFSAVLREALEEKLGVK